MFLYLTRLSTFFRINDVMTWMQGPGVGGGMSHWRPYIMLVNHLLKSTLNEDVLDNFYTLNRKTIDHL